VLRVEEKTLKAPALELAHVANSSFTASHIFRSLPPKLARGLTPGEQMGLFVKATDHPDALQAWRDFHNKMLEFGVGDPKAHEAKLAYLDLAERTLQNPSKRFKEALSVSERVSHEQELLKIESLGLDRFYCRGSYCSHRTGA
jgi:hypothetical protein